MEIGSFFLLLALVIPVSLFIARPLLDKDAAAISQDEDQLEHELSALLAERDRVLNALEELDFDNALGKIPDGDYEPTRERLLVQGAEVLRKIDAIEPGGADADMEQRIEAAIEERRVATSGVDQVQPVVVDADDEVELQLAARRRAREGKSAGFCPKCGRPIQVSDRFCPKCGHTLA